MNVLCIVDQNHERSLVLLDHFRNSKGIQLIVEYNIENEDGILIQRKGNYCSKLKKGKLKIKKLLKLTILDEQEYNTIFSTICRQKQSIARLSKSSHVQWSFIQQKAHFYLRPCSLDNTLYRPLSAWKSFNIRQKLDLFILGVTQISDLPTICIKLTWVGRWVYRSDVKIWHMKYLSLLKYFLISRKKYYVE